MFPVLDSKPMVQGMAAVENLNKNLYKTTLYFLKIIPMLIALCDVLNMGLSFVGIECPVLSYIGGVSFITLMFLFLISYVFKFCVWHRMFLYYAVIINLLSTIDLYMEIPMSDKYLMMLHTTLFGIFLFCTLHLKRKCLN